MALDTKVVRIGSPTDVQPGVFSPAAFGASEFPKVQSAIESRAVDAPTLAAAIAKDQGAAAKQYGTPTGTGPEFPVKFIGVAGKNDFGVYDVKAEGVPDNAADPAFRRGLPSWEPTCGTPPGTISFGQFTNQIEYQNAGSALNKEMKKQVLSKIDTGNLTGKTIAVVGAFQLSDPNKLARHAGEGRGAMMSALASDRRAEDAVLSARNVAKSYGSIHALKGVNFDIHRGKVTTLFGENGAGKSTLMKILSGVVKPTSGTIELDGSPVVFASAAEARDRGISIIHQELSLAPNLSVRDNIFMGREIRTRDRHRLRRGGASGAGPDGRTRGGHRPDDPRRGPAPRAAADRRDRARAFGRLAHPDHGRADLGPERGRGGGAVQGDPGTDGPRRLDRLHLPSPRRGAGDHRPRRGAARRRR